MLIPALCLKIAAGSGGFDARTPVMSAWHVSRRIKRQF
jgi:hypothetical protein